MFDHNKEWARGVPAEKDRPWLIMLYQSNVNKKPKLRRDQWGSLNWRDQWGSPNWSYKASQCHVLWKFCDIKLLGQAKCLLKIFKLFLD